MYYIIIKMVRNEEVEGTIFGRKWLTVNGEVDYLRMTCTNAAESSRKIPA